jgi:hypothetical protein
MKERFPKITKEDGIRLGLFAISQFTDVGTTFAALNGGAKEGNSFINSLLQLDHGETQLILAKMVGIAAISTIYLISKINDKDFETKKLGIKNAVTAATAFFLLLSISNAISGILSH